MRHFILLAAFAVLVLSAALASAQPSTVTDEAKEESAAGARLAALQKLSLEKLFEAYTTGKGPRFTNRHGDKPSNQEVLTEVIRRGDAKCEAFLKKELDAVEATKDPFERRNLALLTALRRVQKKPDPVTIEVNLPKNQKATTRALPIFEVALKNVDEEKAPARIYAGGDYRSGRLARWRFEVKDAKGKLLALRDWDAMMGGGLMGLGNLEHGQTWDTELPMENYVRIQEPGDYVVRILYSDDETIADLPDVYGLILCASKPFKLTVAKAEPKVIEFVAGARERAKALVNQLADDGPIKVVLGRYDKSFHDFIDPKSPEGQLHEMRWDAVPGLLDCLRDEKLSFRRRGWILAMLYAFTEERDFTVFSMRHDRGGVLPAISYRGAGSAGQSEGGDSEAPHPRQVENQRRLANEWLRFAKETWDFREKK